MEHPAAEPASRAVRIRISGRDGENYEFACEPGERILHAGLRGGLELPYECASGTCGTCKATVLEGTTEYAWPEAPGRKYVKPEKGEMLMCQSVALSDCVLRVPKKIERMLAARHVPALIAGRIERVRPLTRDVVAFDVVLEAPISFEAGQFVLLHVDGIPGARSYSMVNFAHDTDRLEFVVKRLPGGRISEWIFGTPNAEGTAVRIFGPLGHATFHPGIAKHVCCIAGGSGIAGMMSILSHAARERYFESYDCNVFFGVRTPSDAFYLQELAALVRQAPERLRVTIALSHEEPTPELKVAYPELAFDSGFVHEAAARAMRGRFADTMVYVAGPPPMVDASLRMLLLEAKVSAANIRYDKFS